MLESKFLQFLKFEGKSSIKFVKLNLPKSAKYGGKRIFIKVKRFYSVFESSFRKMETCG